MYSTTTIIMKKITVGEGDEMVICYTKDFGKIPARVQGVKKEEAKLRGHVEPLSKSAIQFVLGKNGERLVYAELLDAHTGFRGELDCLFAAHYAAALVDSSCLAGEPDANIFYLLEKSLADLAEHKPHGAALEQWASDFERRLLAHLGYAGSADFSVLQQRPIARPDFARYT